MVQNEDIKILTYFLRPYKGRFAAALFLMFLAGALESLNLAAFYPLMNYGLKLENTNPSLKFLDTWIGKFGGGQDLFLSACIFLMVVTAAALVVKLAYHFLSCRLITDVVADHQKKIFDRFLSADYKFFVKSQQGRLIYAGTVAPAGVSSNMLYFLRILQSAMASLCFIVLMFFLSWQGMALILVFGVLYTSFIRGLLKKVVNKYAHMTVEEERKKNVILNEFINGIKTIKAYNTQEFWRKKYNQVVTDSAFYNLKVLIGRAVPDSVLKFLFFMIFAVIGIVLNARFHGDLLPWIPIMGTFAAAASRLMPYVNIIGGDVVSMARFMPDVKIVYHTLQEPMQDVHDGERDLKEFKSSLVFNNVWFRYEGMEDPLLKGVSFTVDKNKVTAIVGPSGSGKTSIVNLLLRLYDPQDGKVTIDGIDLRDVKIESYLSKVGYVSQETFIFNGTIKDNIRFGLEASDQQVREAAYVANAEEFILASENGFDTIVGDSGMKLSGGQRQRLAIARAMLRKPQIVILDEATSSLDNISERAVQKAIENISHNTTVLVIAHRLSTVQNADKIVVLEHGNIIEAGTHQELLVKENAYFRLYNNS